MTVESCPIDVDLHRDHWLALRKPLITASEVSAVFGEEGKNPFMTALDLYLAKIHGPKQFDDDATMRGRHLEAAALSHTREDRPNWQIKNCDNFYRDRLIGIGATPDSVNCHGEPVEFKCPFEPTFYEKWTDQPPIHNQLQALVQAMLMDAPRAWLVAYIVTTFKVSLHTYEVPRHPAAEKQIMDGVTAFWQRIKDGNPPPAQYGRDTEALSMLYPRDDGSAVDLTGDNRLPDLLARRVSITTKMRELTQEKQTIDDELRDKLGEAEEGTLPGWRLTWKTEIRKEKLFTPSSSTRVLRVSDRRKKEGLT